MSSSRLVNSTTGRDHRQRGPNASHLPGSCGWRRGIRSQVIPSIGWIVSPSETSSESGAWTNHLHEGAVHAGPKYTEWRDHRDSPPTRNDRQLHGPLFEEWVSDRGVHSPE